MTQACIDYLKKSVRRGPVAGNYIEALEKSSIDAEKPQNDKFFFFWGKGEGLSVVFS